MIFNVGFSNVGLLLDLVEVLLVKDLWVLKVLEVTEFGLELVVGDVLLRTFMGVHFEGDALVAGAGAEEGRGGAFGVGADSGTGVLANEAERVHCY